MNNSITLTIMTLLTAVLMIGATFALLFSTHTLGKQRSPWSLMKNFFLLITDVVIGLIMGLFVISKYGVLSNLDGVVVFALLTHGYRDWEYLTGISNAFCTNRPLFIVNNAKIIGLLVILGVRIAQTWL